MSGNKEKKKVEVEHDTKKKEKTQKEWEAEVEELKKQLAASHKKLRHLELEVVKKLEEDLKAANEKIEDLLMDQEAANMEIAELRRTEEQKEKDRETETNLKAFANYFTEHVKNEAEKQKKREDED